MPVDKLRKFILAIDDIEERKEVAYRWKDHQSALEVSSSKDYRTRSLSLLINIII